MWYASKDFQPCRIVRMVKKQARVTFKEFTDFWASQTRITLYQHGLESHMNEKLPFLKNQNIEIHLKLTMEYLYRPDYLLEYLLVWCDQNRVIWFQFTSASLDEEFKLENTVPAVKHGGMCLFFIRDYFMVQDYFIQKKEE